MTNKLLDHFRRMQGVCVTYLADHHTPKETLDGIFIGSMIEGLDGPAQREAQAWAEFDYMAESERTAPPAGHYHGELIDADLFLERLQTFIEAAVELDRYKKLMFYGEDFNKKRFADPFVAGGKRGVRILEGVVNETIDGPWLGTEQAEQVIHAVLGIASEAGEVAEALFNVAIRGEEGDRANFLEEVGDLQWYEAMLARVFHKDFDDIQRTNIAKLRARFPDKFAEDNANNRDLSAERAILEAGAQPDREAVIVAALSGQPVSLDSPYLADAVEAVADKLSEPRVKTQFEGLPPADLAETLGGVRVGTPADRRPVHGED